MIEIPRTMRSVLWYGPEDYRLEEIARRGAGFPQAVQAWFASYDPGPV
jgi:hypothetical protein